MAKTTKDTTDKGSTTGDASETTDADVTGTPDGDVKHGTLVDPEGVENAARNAGYPTTSGDYEDGENKA